MNPKDESRALFWCGLLAPVLFGDVSSKEIGRYLRSLAETECTFPDGQRKKPSLSTLRRKLKLYRQGGFEALLPGPRSDRGKSRKYTQAMIQRAVELKKEQPFRSEETINQFLQQEFGQSIPRSTLYHYLKSAGATRLKLGVTETKVRCRWTRDHTHALWLGDFEEGPYVLHEGQAFPTYLSAFIDCYSRYIVEARYYYRQNLDILIDSLLRAWAVHGASRELYVDNAKIYHANALQAACYALNIRLIHRTAGDPSPGGLIERFFETTQSQFEAEVRVGDILTLDRLNRGMSAWLEESYHRRVHSETGQTPQERYRLGLKFTRHVDTQKAVAFFLRKVIRTVHRQFADVQLEGTFFRVDPRLRGDKVEVRYDPFTPLEQVLLYSTDGQYLGVGTRYQREKGAHGPTPPPPSRGKPKHNYLQLLIDKHEQRLEAAAGGIDYHAVMARRAWPFAEFAKTLATRLGRPGGLGAFSAEELETLQKVYSRQSQLDEPLLREAVECAEPKTIPMIVFHLQQLAQRRRR
jgi:transposase InsO family protein